MPGPWNRLATLARERLVTGAFQRVDAASLAFFRISFGLLVSADAVRKLVLGRVGPAYLIPRLHFKYVGFEWITVWPGDGIYVHFVALSVFGLLIALGIFTRFSAMIFCLLFSYAFLLDQMYYLNHYYLIILISLLLAVAPTDTVLSARAWWRRRKGLRADAGSRGVPAWALWLLRAQIAIPYFYGGIAKIEADWLSGVPMYIWLREGPLFGPTLAALPYVPLLLAWFGLLFDLLIVPAVVWRRTRVFAFIAALGFHAFNHVLFKIGVFPFLMLGATTIFFSPDWPRSLPWIGRYFEEDVEPASTALEGSSALLPAGKKLILAALGIYLLLQLVLPFREYLYPGNSDWTEEGHCFSWKMKLRQKTAKALLVIKDPARGELGSVEPDDFFSVEEARRLAERPDFVLQFAHYMRDEFKKRGVSGVEIYGRSLVSLNGRKPADMIDRNVDLAKVELSILPATWIMALTEPLPSLAEMQAASAGGSLPAP